MDSLRRFAGGTLAEVMGPQLLESDRDARRLRLRRIAEEAYATLPAADRAAFAAYTRGVNYFISTHLNSLPVEFTLLNYQPRPWSVVDCLLMCLYMYRSLTTTWKDEIVKANLLAQGDRAKVEFLFPSARAPAWPARDRTPGRFPDATPPRGKPLLSNDMHLEYSLPGIWYMTAPAGARAGCRRRGRCRARPASSWATTSASPGALRICSSTCRISTSRSMDERTGRYLFRGQVEQARDEREIIRVKGRPGGGVDSAGSRATVPSSWPTARSAWPYAGRLPSPACCSTRSSTSTARGNWTEFTAAIKRLSGPGSNFVYADVDGNIGYHAAGMLPQPPAVPRRCPGGWLVRQFRVGWLHSLRASCLPRYNPPSGMIVTANQNPFPGELSVSGERQLRAAVPRRADPRPALRARRLARRRTCCACRAISTRGSAISWRSRWWRPIERRNAEKPGSGSGGRPAAQVERADGQGPGRALADHPDLSARAPRWRENASSASDVVYEFNLAPVAVEKLLRERPAGWFDDYDEMLLRALVDAVEEARACRAAISIAGVTATTCACRID